MEGLIFRILRYLILVNLQAVAGGKSVPSGCKFYRLQCSTLTLVHFPRTSENSRWASKNVLLLAPRPVTLVDKF